MIRTQGVSFPRSGHDVVYHALKLYFADDFVYCDPDHAKPTPAICGCRSVPCVNPANTFSKNHDLGLLHGEGFAFDPKERYFVQYRSPVRSIVSNFHLHAANHPNDASRFGWTRFAYEQSAYWNNFVDKWVMPFREDQRFLFLPYEELLADPVDALARVAEYLGGGPADRTIIQRHVEGKGVAPRNNLARFQYYDEEFLGRLEEAAGDRREKLGLPSFLQGV